MELYCSKKNLPALLRGITSKHDGDFIVWIFFIRLEQKINLNHIKKYVKKMIFYNIVIPFEDTEISKFNQNQKLSKTPFMQILNLW